MAKRRRVSAPSAAEIERIEAEFRDETVKRPGGAMAPISQIVAQSAEDAPVTTPENRAHAARDATDAETLRAAQADGRVILNIRLDQIDDVAIVRDRTVLDPDEMRELRLSIAEHGMRLPVEVFEQTEPDGRPYGLISGYRRVQAMRELAQTTNDPAYHTIRALVRDPQDLGGAVTAMVEENEVRANLSHFERGRISVIAAQQGMFASVEDAVAQLFSAASKAKRSKIRSFAVIYEELGDMLEFPENLKETQGLRVANALRNGMEGRFREVLASDKGTTPTLEWDLLDHVCREYESAAQPDRTRGGRPKVRAPEPGWQSDTVLRLSGDITLQRQHDGDGYLIRLKGRGVNVEIVEEAMRLLERGLKY